MESQWEEGTQGEVGEVWRDGGRREGVTVKWKEVRLR